MTGIGGQSKMKIETKSDKSAGSTSIKGLNLLHDFWDFEAYRAFKEAIRHDSTAVLCRIGDCSRAPGPDEDSVLYKSRNNNG